MHARLRAQACDGWQSCLSLRLNFRIIQEGLTMPNIDETPPLNAEAFLKVFLEKYNGKYIENQDSWEEIWQDTCKWSKFMIECVIREVNYPNIRCHNGEPLRLDAVFTTSPDKWDWFPISIALEHENNPIGVHGEIKKLISIDCPLKVMITYSLIEDSISIEELQEKNRQSTKKYCIASYVTVLTPSHARRRPTASIPSPSTSLSSAE